MSHLSVTICQGVSVNKTDRLSEPNWWNQTLASPRWEKRRNSHSFDDEMPEFGFDTTEASVAFMLTCSEASFGHWLGWEHYLTWTPFFVCLYSLTCFQIKAIHGLGWGSRVELDMFNIKFEFTGAWLIITGKWVSPIKKDKTDWCKPTHTCTPVPAEPWLSLLDHLHPSCHSSTIGNIGPCPVWLAGWSVCCVSGGVSSHKA